MNPANYYYLTFSFLNVTADMTDTNAICVQKSYKRLQIYFKISVVCIRIQSDFSDLPAPKI